MAAFEENTCREVTRGHLAGRRAVRLEADSGILIVIILILILFTKYRYIVFPK